MAILCEMIIGARSVRGAGIEVFGFNPATREDLQPGFGQATGDDVERACALASEAVDPYRALPLEQRAAFLELVAEEILAIGPELIERAQLETGLPQARLEGERMRTVTQLRLFAKVVRDGYFMDATIDSALPERAPPRPDLRLRKIGLGPVVVFGASNFPLAFSVAGGDTASALAAGCPVVVKAHGAHPGTSELVGRAVQRAVKASGLPEGVQKILKASREVQRKIEELQQQIQQVLADRGPGEDERNSRIATLRSSMGRLQQQVSNYSADLSVLMSRLKLDGGSRTLVSSLMVPNEAR